MNFGSWFWTSLFSIGTLFEVWAIFFKVQWTLTYQVWAFRDQTGAQGFFTFFIAIVLWSLWHFVTEGRP